ncbi:MAG: FAD binding domain-containing protein [Burkholderiaceae bacterium]
MKASSFRFARVQSVDEALTLLHEGGGEARLIAGGQSLVPMMAMRLATPVQLIDINRITEINQANRIDSDLVTGATMRQCDLMSHPGLTADLPLVHAAMPWVGHQQTRNRGTVGGSIVQADPSAELPLTACVLGAQLQLQAYGGRAREIDAGSFFEGPLQTAITDTEMLCAVRWPVWQTGAGETVQAIFDEVAIRHGDFAIASAACQLQVSTDGVIRRAAFGLGGVDSVPRAFPELAARMVNQTMTPELATEIAADAASQCDPGSDIHGSAQYRRHLARVLLARALQRSASQAQVMAQGVY